MIPTTHIQTALPLPPFARVAFGVANAVLGWELRRKTRARLATLDTHLLADIGLTAHEAEQESARPFWR